MRCPLTTQSGLMQRNKKPRFGGVLFGLYLDRQVASYPYYWVYLNE